MHEPVARFLLSAALEQQNMGKIGESRSPCVQEAEVRSGGEKMFRSLSKTLTFS